MVLSAVANPSKSSSELEEKPWQLAIVENSKYIRLRNVSAEMLTDEGEVITVGDEDPFNIRFDVEFVYHWITEKLFRPLGLVAPDGSVKEKFILNHLIPHAIEYARSESQREAAQRRLQIASQMSAFNGRSVEENLELLAAKESAE